ncbi:MAG: restriction endonuclease subunit S [Candidatus Pacebacteria bacterium]|nr:restriction endonuclease subunit S [Candidatus Paceibacterota bacterium]
MKMKLVQISDIRDKKIPYSFTGGPFGSDLKQIDYTEKGIRIIQLQNIGDGAFNNTYKIFTSEEKANQLHSCLIYPGDIIIAKMADPLGRACIVPDFEEKYLMGSDGIRLAVDKKQYDAKYIMEIINSNTVRRKIERLGTGSTRLRIGLTEISKLSFDVHDLEEQKKIAEILSTWDTAIEVQNRLIIEKRSFLENLSLALVKNHRSLSSSTTSWKLTPLSEVFKENKEYAFESESLKLYSLTIEDGVTPKTDRYNREFLVKGGSKKYKVTKFHDLVFNPQNLRYGAIALNENENPVLLSPIYATMEVKNKEIYDIHYFTYLLTSKEMIKYYDSIAEGTLVERMTVKPDVFLKQEFMIPPYEEQKKISTILNEIKKEITLLEQELECRKLQKKGLMQQLLTGNIRVKTS